MVPTPQPTPYGSSVRLELAKALKLVAPSTMSAESQATWLLAAEEALEDISASEIAAVSMEIRRSVTRPAQIVPEIARLVSERRHRTVDVAAPASPYAKEMKISGDAQERRAKARTAAEIDDAYEWERSERAAAGLSIPPRAAPLTRDELNNMLPHIKAMGLNSGFLKMDGNRLVEVTDVHEIERIREAKRQSTAAGMAR